MEPSSNFQSIIQLFQKAVVSPVRKKSLESVKFNHFVGGGGKGEISLFFSISWS